MEEQKKEKEKSETLLSHAMTNVEELSNVVKRKESEYQELVTYLADPDPRGDECAEDSQGRAMSSHLRSALRRGRSRPPIEGTQSQRNVVTMADLAGSSPDPPGAVINTNSRSTVFMSIADADDQRSTSGRKRATEEVFVTGFRENPTGFQGRIHHRQSPD